jgi:UV DNA damage repair endonuclease
MKRGQIFSGTKERPFIKMYYSFVITNNILKKSYRREKMIIRFGYVSMALSLWEASPSRTITFTNWKKLEKDARMENLYELTEKN